MFCLMTNYILNMNSKKKLLNMKHVSNQRAEIVFEPIDYRL